MPSHLSMEDVYRHACEVIPGGVSSPVRAFGSVGGTPRFMAGARGPYLTDVEGREYVDLVCSWGPMLLGHQHPEVIEAVHAAVDRGLGFGTSTLEETALAELITLGRTLKKRAADVLAYFDHPGTSNGPTEAINGRLEHLRGSALGFRNLTNYIARSLLETGGFRPALHPRL